MPETFIIAKTKNSSEMPIPLIVSFFVSIVIFVYMIIIGDNVLPAIIYTPVLFGTLYYMFCRYSCKIVIDENYILIKYYSKKKEIKITFDKKEDVKIIVNDYGLYNFFSSKVTSPYILAYCYDRVNIKVKNDNYYLKINTNNVFYTEYLKRAFPSFKI